MLYCSQTRCMKAISCGDKIFCFSEVCVRETEREGDRAAACYYKWIGFSFADAGPFCEEMNCFILQNRCLCFYLYHVLFSCQQRDVTLRSLRVYRLSYATPTYPAKLHPNNSISWSIYSLISHQPLVPQEVELCPCNQRIGDV